MLERLNEVPPLNVMISELSSPMFQILEHPNIDTEHLVFPVPQPHHHNNEVCLAIAQVTHFDCGGIAIVGCLSHKIGDGVIES